MAKPIVSIVIPAYNAGAYIKEAVDSALAQTYPAREIVVVDDGSTDKTKDVLKPYVDAHKIKYIFQTNRGLSAARNTGIKTATGAYIALLDADDIFLPEKIEKQVAYLEAHPEADISYCDLWHFYDGESDKLLKLQYRYYSGGEVFKNLLHYSFIAPLAVVLRKNVFDRFGYFDEKMHRSEDLEFWLRIAYAGGQFQFLPERLAKLRLRKEGNLQGLESQPAMKTANLALIESYSAKMTPQQRKEYGLQELLVGYRLKTAFSYILIGEKKQAKPYIKGAFRGYPLGWLVGRLIWWFGLAWIPAVLLRRIVLVRYLAKKASRFVSA